MLTNNITSEDKFLRTSQIATYCKVTSNSVKKWIKTRKLKAFKTPGGHYRILKDDFEDFLVLYNMPIDPEIF